MDDIGKLLRPSEGDRHARACSDAAHGHCGKPWAMGGAPPGLHAPASCCGTLMPDVFEPLLVELGGGGVDVDN